MKDTETGRRLKEIRESTGLSQKDFADMFGVAPSTYNRYESGEIERMKMPLVDAICKKFNINVGWLVGVEDDKYIIREKAFQKTKRIPVYDSITSEPLYENQNIIDYLIISKENPADFCVKVKDDSMSGARILNSDTVYVSKDGKAENGDIVLAVVDGSTVIRRFAVVDGLILLSAEMNGKVTAPVGGKGAKIIGVVTAFHSVVNHGKL